MIVIMFDDGKDVTNDTLGVGDYYLTEADGCRRIDKGYIAVTPEVDIVSQDTILTTVDYDEVVNAHEDDTAKIYERTEDFTGFWPAAKK